jgi:CrcB protein
MLPWLAVFIGGGAGSVLRFAISRAFLKLGIVHALPWATLLTNLLATGVLAWLVMRWDIAHPSKETWRALLAVGFCGGFSTLSTFSMENYQLLRDGAYAFAALNIIVSVAGGVLLFHLFANRS